LRVNCAVSAAKSASIIRLRAEVMFSDAVASWTPSRRSGFVSHPDARNEFTWLNAPSIRAMALFAPVTVVSSVVDSVTSAAALLVSRH